MFQLRSEGRRSQPWEDLGRVRQEETSSPRVPRWEHGGRCGCRAEERLAEVSRCVGRGKAVGVCQHTRYWDP